jgi:type I restriction enzyme S subunit
MGSAGPNGFHDIAKAKGPGVVIGRSGVGSMGVVSYTQQDFWPHNTVLYVTDFKGNDERFVYYFLSRLDLRRYNSGSAQASLNRNYIYPIPIRIPSRSFQQRIADILGTLDDKIELNRQMNETLEAMARRLFKSWFVDFDPVHVKAALRREHPRLSNADLSRRALPNMAPEIAELFPDGFVESMLGRIPRGWNVGTIGDLALLTKSSVTPSNFPDEFFDHYSIPAFDDGMMPPTEPGNQIMSNKFVVTPDCVLLTKLNPRIPRVWLPFPTDSRRSICSTEFLVLLPAVGVPREFLFSLVSSRTFFEIYETMVTGTSGSHQRIRPEHLLKMETVIPQVEEREAFAEIAARQFTQAHALRLESHSLRMTRDSLLPKLLSGELFPVGGVN